MEIIDFGNDPGTAITEYASRGATSVELAHGDGDAFVRVVHVHAGGEIGPHTAEFGQLFVVVTGSGWIKEADGPRLEIDAGEAAYFPRGTVHAKGSDHGMTALMVQVRHLHRERPG
jgi:quercetin dioxygenase-like cupin family protein